MITASIKNVKYDRGNDDRYYYGRRQYVSAVCSDGVERTCGMGDGRIVAVGDELRMCVLGEAEDVLIIE